MKIIFITIFLAMSFSALADQVKVEVTTPRPAVGENFQALFRVFTESAEEPSISFTPSGVEVVGKANQGVSTRTIYANGKLTVTREVLISYELTAKRAGTAFLRDISVQIGEQRLRHRPVSINVLKEPEAAADVFVMAEVPKKEVYIGEGITVRYYLYSKVPFSALDVKRYPKLNNFLKRFLQEPDRSERVSANGELYIRNQIYAAKLFPEKTGQLKIDSISLSATYQVSRPGDPFGTFGYGRDVRRRTLNSEPVSIIVKPLPEPVPADFTGLVGRHDFSLEFGQQKLIVNEPLNIKLIVSGPGALENMEAPEIIKHPGLEEFETNGDLKINDAELATKTFEYTFLAKENLHIPASELTLSYLDPETGRYIPSNLAIPEIQVAGGVARSRPQEDPKEEVPKRAEPSPAQAKVRLADPVLTTPGRWSGLLPYLNFSLAGLSVLLVLTGLVRFKHFTFTKVPIPPEFKRGHFSFGEFARWLSPLIGKTGKPPLHIIKDSELDEETKKYFVELINSTEQQDYSNRKNSSTFRYEPKYFKKLGHYIESAKNEDLSESL